MTIDVIGCQRGIAEKIIKQGGHYLLAVKANQGTLFESVAEFYAEGQRHGFGSLAVSRFETLGKDHGRIEYPKRSLRSRRKTTDRLADYRQSLLGLQARG